MMVREQNSLKFIRTKKQVSEGGQQNIGRWEVAVSVVTDLTPQKPSQNQDSDGPRMAED